MYLGMVVAPITCFDLFFILVYKWCYALLELCSALLPGRWRGPKGKKDNHNEDLESFSTVLNYLDAISM